MFPPDPPQKNSNAELENGAVMTLTIAIEAILLLCASLWMYFEKINIGPLMLPVFNKRAWLIGLLVGNIISVLNLIWLWAGKKWSSHFLLRSMQDLVMLEMVPIFGRLQFGERLALALISGFCEEVFFRGILEGACGTATSAFCFGLAHFPSLYYFPYAVWAFLVGLLMSFLTQLSGSLWCPIIAHAMINLVSLNVIATLWKRQK